MVLKIRVILMLFMTLSCKASAQDTTRHNQIIYAEGLVGLTTGAIEGLSAELSLNHQFRSNLLTARYTGIADLRVKASQVGFLAFPYLTVRARTEEYAVLYGKRHTRLGHSYSVSLGVSYNKYYRNVVDANDFKITSVVAYAGLPYEMNIKWFKRNKERFRIYGLIPVGKPTAFGGSLGIKLFGNFAKHKHIGIGVTMGYGFHKRY